MIPCGDPPHRATPMSAAQDRKAMLALAIADEPCLELDDRELQRQGPSYSIDTLIELRTELGDQQSLCFCIGLDSLLTLPTWHRWREILNYAHLIVAVRPGWQIPELGVVAEWLETYRTEDLETVRNNSAGAVYIDEMTLLPVAATDLRKALENGESVRYLTTDAVIQYIRDHNLYM